MGQIEFTRPLASRRMIDGFAKAALRQDFGGCIRGLAQR